MDYDGTSEPGLIRRLVTGTWRAIDGLRRFAVNLIFILILVALVAGAVGGRPKVPSSAALVIDPRGPIVEQLSGSPRDRLLGGLTSPAARQETLLKDLLQKAFAGSCKDLVLAALSDHVTDKEREEIKRFLKENPDA